MSSITSQLKQNREKLSKEVQLQLLRDLYKQSFYDFFQDAVKILEPNTNWNFNWHHKYLADILQKEAFRVNSNLPREKDYCISVPPRTSKSLLISVCYNAWVWSLNPYASFIVVSHTEALAIDLSFKTKKLIESVWYQELFPNVKLRSDRSSVLDYENIYGGKRQSFSMGGGSTGFGADFLILDDPIKPQDVSQLQLNTAIRTYKEVLYNRVNNPATAVRFVISQRLALNDIIGYILEHNDNNRYFNICLPAELTSNISPPELSANYSNGYLWEERFPGEILSDIKNGLGSYGYSAQYLQQPVNLENALIKPEWLEIVETSPAISYFAFIDTAQTDKRKNDPSTILLAGTKDGIVYIKDCREYFLEFPELVKKISEVNALKIYVEPKSNGKDIVNVLKREPSINIIELPPPKVSKFTRASAITPKLESKKVKLVRGNWNESFLDNCSSFPQCKNDGVVDVLVYAVNTLLSATGKIQWYM